MSEIDVEVVEEISCPKTPLERLGIEPGYELTKSEMIAAISQLEKENPTSRPAESPLLNGVWEVVSTGYGSAGLLIYQALKALPSPIKGFARIGELTVTIRRSQPRVTAACKANIGPSTSIGVESTAELVSTDADATIIKEVFSGLRIGSMDLPDPKDSIREKLTRELVVTYLDDELLIVRDCVGAAEVLRRKEMEGRFNLETDPENSDDEEEEAEAQGEGSGEDISEESDAPGASS